MLLNVILPAYLMSILLLLLMVLLIIQSLGKVQGNSQLGERDARLYATCLGLFHCCIPRLCLSPVMPASYV